MEIRNGKQFVVITGFGPFGEHDVNASWVAVQELAKRGLDEDDIDLISVEMPVIYETVEKVVKELWEKYNPVLMVHVGVSGMASELTLEQRSFNKGYTYLDVNQKCPASEICVNECCEESLHSCIDMALVSEQINNAETKVKAVVSHDPGKYLCGFSYFLSLHKDKKRSAFIHVPVLDKPYTGEELAQGLFTAVKSMLNQVRQSLPSN